MVNANTDDRRQHTRVGFTTAMQVVIDADGKKRIDVSGDSKDLSMKGVFVRADSQLAIGTKCRVTIFLETGEDPVELQMKASVVREANGGMGLEFDSIDVDSYAHLRNIVRYNSFDGSE